MPFCLLDGCIKSSVDPLLSLIDVWVELLIIISEELKTASKFYSRSLFHVVDSEHNSKLVQLIFMFTDAIGENG